MLIPLHTYKHRPSIPIHYHLLLSPAQSQPDDHQTMKELTFQSSIPGCSIKEFYRIAISDEQAISRFHREVNKDDSVKVSPWSGDGKRVVEFILAMSIPKSVQSFIGAGPVRIKEGQTVEWLDDSTLSIVSLPEVQVTYAKSLVTRAELLIRGTEAGVSIDVKVVVTASVPWPMTGTVEAIMVDQAKKTVGQYVEYIGKYVEAALEDANNNLRRGQEESADAAAQLAQEAMAMLPPPQQQQQQLELGPPTPPESTAAAAAIAAVAPSPAAVAAAAAATPLVPRQQVQALVPNAAAAAEADVFYDAHEVVPGSTLELLLRELREAKAAREQTNRLLQSIQHSVQQMDHAVTKELAFQEGMRHAQMLSNRGSWFMSVAATAAIASATTAYILMRRNAL